MNELYPIFLKAQELKFLIVGGGDVGEEKLYNLLRSSPNAWVLVLAPSIKAGIYALAKHNPRIKIIQESFNPYYLNEIDIAIIATERPLLNKKIRDLAKSRGILTNVADTPEYCDFYMGSIVTKGDLKIGISTNGQSPTFAKRFRQMLEDSLPENIPELLKGLRKIRDRLKGDFSYKVNRLNELTAELAAKPTDKKIQPSPVINPGVFRL